MSGKPIAPLVGDPPPANEVESLVLETIVKRHPALVAMEELMQALADPSVIESVEPCFIDEAVDLLIRSGLVHKLGDGYVFATHSAVRAKELLRL